MQVDCAVVPIQLLFGNLIFKIMRIGTIKIAEETVMRVLFAEAKHSVVLSLVRDPIPHSKLPKYKKLRLVIHAHIGEVMNNLCLL